MDKMTIIGRDGKPKYIVQDGEVLDMKYCHCRVQDLSYRAEVLDGLKTGRILCTTCGLEAPPDTTSKEKK